MAPKTKEQFALMRAQSEENILQAALELFATKGFKATSIAEIAQSANVSKGLIYNYFASKNELLRKIVGRAMEMGHDLLESVLKEYESPRDELEHLVLDLFQMVKQNRSYWRLLTALSFQPDAIRIVEDLVAENAQWSVQKGTEIFQALGARNALRSAQLFGAALDGIFLQYLLAMEHYPFDEIAQELIDTFIGEKNIHNNYQE